MQCSCHIRGCHIRGKQKGLTYQNVQQQLKLHQPPGYGVSTNSGVGLGGREDAGCELTRPSLGVCKAWIGCGGPWGMGLWGTGSGAVRGGADAGLEGCMAVVDRQENIAR